VRDHDFPRVPYASPLGGALILPASGHDQALLLIIKISGCMQA
jgi:hypothetical protein